MVRLNRSMWALSFGLPMRVYRCDLFTCDHAVNGVWADEHSLYMPCINCTEASGAKLLNHYGRLDKSVLCSKILFGQL